MVTKPDWVCGGRRTSKTTAFSVQDSPPHMILIGLTSFILIRLLYYINHWVVVWVFSTPVLTAAKSEKRPKKKKQIQTQKSNQSSKLSLTVYNIIRPPHNIFPRTP